LPNEHSVDNNMKKSLVTETTLKLIAKQGMQATPMSQIARESGVAIGTIYHHFPSKEEILKEIYLDIKQDFGELIASSLIKGNPPEENFNRLWKAFCRYYLENPLKFKFLQQVVNSPYIDSDTREEGESHFSKAVDFFEQGIRSGRFISMDTLLMVEMTHGNVEKYVELVLLDRIENNEKNQKNAIAFSWDAVRNIQ